MKKKLVAHKMIADYCVEFAEQVYEELAHNDKFYKLYDDRKAFVKTLATEDATRKHVRQLLAERIALTHDEVEKWEIYEALLLDKTIPDGAQPSNYVLPSQRH